MHILIVEDEKPLARLLSESLEAAGYTAASVGRGDEALDHVTSCDFDAVVLDLSLPGTDGLDVLRQMRERRIPTPVLVMTARGETHQRIEGLYSGADDYVAKPCDMDEIVARVHALVRRSGVKPGQLQMADLVLDTQSRDVRRAGKRIELTDREFILLETLIRSAGKPLTRMQLLERVFGYRFQPETNIIEVHIKNLRKKIDTGFDRQLIQTVIRVGYVMQDSPYHGGSTS